MLYSIMLWIQAFMKPEELLPFSRQGVKCLDCDIDRVNWTTSYLKKEIIIVTKIQSMEEVV